MYFEDTSLIFEAFRVPLVRLLLTIQMQKMLQNFQAEESSHEAHPHFKIMDFIPCFDRKGGEVLIPIPFLIYYMYII